MKISQNTIMTAIFLLIFLVIFLFMYVNKEQVGDFGNRLLKKCDRNGVYLMLLLLTTLSSTIIPLPVWAYVGTAIYLGLNPFGIAIVSGIGTTLGSCTTYALGRYFSDVKWVTRRFHTTEKKIATAKNKFAGYGAFILFLVALTPFPSDPYYFGCGFFKFPFFVYAPVVLVARTLRYLIMGGCLERIY